MENPNAWMAEWINAAIPSSGRWAPAEVAEKLVASLEEHHPDEFTEWMRHNAARFVKQTILDRHRSERARALHLRRGGVFAEAAERHADGDGHAFDPFRDITYAIDETDGTRMALGDMTGADCRKAAALYRRRERENAMEAAFLEAVAKRVRRKPVNEVLSSEQVQRLLDSCGLGVAA